MRVLFQFFDPKHHCFTFPDYQLVPTLEEFSRLLGIPILDQIPFSGLEKVPKSEEVAAALHMTKSDIETNWVTRSGRLFAPQPLRDAAAESSARAKGKQTMVDEEPAQKEAEGSFQKDVEEFMKIIKKSDYKIVDQLNQTPSKIS